MAHYPPHRVQISLR
uniref:Uncharacterized protein n=1 Tax=Arundo donax TaxID=35708 RepID=A0A0A9A5T2_ARUDO